MGWAKTPFFNAGFLAESTALNQSKQSQSQSQSIEAIAIVLNLTTLPRCQNQPHRFGVASTTSTTD